MGRLGATALLRLILAVRPLAIAAPTCAETCLALIITNASYPAEIGPLSNPHKDGTVIAVALKNVGFEKDNYRHYQRCGPADLAHRSR